MPRYKVAHLHEQQQDMIIVPLESNFKYKTSDDQQHEIEALQLHATGAGLKGRVVPVWDNGGGCMGFNAPPNWHPYFKSINLAFVFAKINRELYW